MEGVGSANPPVSHPGLTMGLPLPPLTTTHVPDTLDNTNLGRHYLQRLSHYDLVVDGRVYRVRIYADDHVLTDVSRVFELDAVDDLDPATQPGR